MQLVTSALVWIGVAICVAVAAPIEIIPQTHSMVLVIANERRCVYAHTETANERVFFQYQVRSGSNDFALTIEHPDGEMVFYAEAGEHHHEDRVFFVTKQMGEYSFCIDNSGRGRDEKVIRLSVAMLSVKKLKKKLDPLLKTMVKAEAGLIALNEDQAYLRAREADHRVTIESNNTRILVRWLLEIAAIVGLSYGQIHMLQKLFKKKTERAA
jgi:p24 family protein beta-1